MSECKNCSSGTRLIFTCSGAANVGNIADCAARILAKDNYGKMLCLSAIGAKLSNYLQSAKDADENVVIDGCNIFCGKKIFDEAGLKYTSYLVTDMGLEKGISQVTNENIQKVVSTIKHNS